LIRISCKGLSEALCILFPDTKGIHWADRDANVKDESGMHGS